MLQEILAKSKNKNLKWLKIISTEIQSEKN